MAPREAAEYLGFSRREVIAWAKGESTPPADALAKMYFLFDEQEAEASRILEDWELAGKPIAFEFTAPGSDETAKAAGWPSQPAYMVAVAIAQATLGPVEIKLLYQ